MFNKFMFETKMYNRHFRRLIQSRLNRGGFWDDEGDLMAGFKKRRGFTKAIKNRSK